VSSSPDSPVTQAGTDANVPLANVAGVKNIVFDFGGVLFRWQPHEFMPRLLPHRAGSESAVNALVADFFQSYGGDWGDFDRGRVDEARLVQRIAWRTGMDADEVQKVIDAVPEELQLMPHAQPLLRRLRERGLRLFYLSNMPRPYAAHLARVHPLGEWFIDGVFSSHVGLMKPEPAMFHHAASAFGIAPRETLFVDDFALNIKAARALGWNALHFLSAAQCEADLTALGVL
jgi:epoxide hydrolase-like predicted phosphatase